MKTGKRKPGQAIRRAVFGGDGRLRAGWRWMAGVAAYAAAFLAVVGGLGAAFGALFSAWGLTQDNLAYAPRWAQAVVAWHADVIYLAAYLASAAVGWAAARGWTARAERAGRSAGFAALSGAALGALVTALSLGLDSMRLERPLGEPALSMAQASALALMAAGCLSREVLGKRLLFDPLCARLGRGAGYAAGAVAFALLSGVGWNPVGFIAALMMGVVGCAMYERGGLRASALLCIGWSVWTSVLFAWPGAGSSAVYRMYAVSDAWLTGGEAGALCGFAALAAWSILAAIVLREDLRRVLNQIKQGKGRENNGKDSNRNRGTGIPRGELLRTGAAGDAGSRRGGRAGRAQSRAAQSRR